MLVDCDLLLFVVTTQLCDYVAVLLLLVTVAQRLKYELKSNKSKTET